MRYEKGRKILGMDELQVHKLMRFLALPLAAAVLIVVILIADLPKRRRAASDGQTAEAVETAEGAGAGENQEAATEPYDYANAVPERSANAELDALVSSYLKARIDGDADAMYRIFGISDQTGLEAMRQKLSQEKKLYESFENTVSYLIPGVEADSWIAYISTQGWFRKIETPAPMLMRAYIVRDAGGQYRMKREETLTEEEKGAISTAEGAEAVKKMNSEQRTALAKAIVSDAKLGSLYERLRAGAETGAAVQESEAESTAAADIQEAVVEVGGATETTAAAASVAAGGEEAASSEVSVQEQGTTGEASAGAEGAAEAAPADSDAAEHTEGTTAAQ